MGTFSGKTAIVTGGAQGMGRRTLGPVRLLTGRRAHAGGKRGCLGTNSPGADAASGDVPDRSATQTIIRAALPSLRHVVCVPYSSSRKNVEKMQPATAPSVLTA